MSFSKHHLPFAISLYSLKTIVNAVLLISRKWLAENKHIKYLWIPYTDAVVVVQCNPISKGRNPKHKPKYGKDEALRQIRTLYHDSLEKYR